MSPVVPQTPININASEARGKKSAGDDGKEERDFLSPSTFPSSPFHQCRNSLPRPFFDRLRTRDDWDESVVKSSWSHTQARCF